VKLWLGGDTGPEPKRSMTPQKVEIPTIPAPASKDEQELAAKFPDGWRQKR
jgi:hypothetical protein